MQIGRLIATALGNAWIMLVAFLLLFQLFGPWVLWILKVVLVTLNGL